MAGGSLEVELRMIAYRKAHGRFDLDDFVSNYLPLTPKIRAALDEPVLLNKLDTFLAQLDEGFDETLESRSEEWQTFIALYGSIPCVKPEQVLKTCYSEKLIPLYDNLYHRVEKEGDGGLLELFTFLLFRGQFPGAVNAMFAQYPDREELITARCQKALGALRFTINEEAASEEATPEKEQLRYKCARLSAWFLGEAVLWKGLKPLLLVFRASKKPYLNSDLSSSGGDNNLVDTIFCFLDHDNGEKLKALRQDMAKGLADLLKPLPQSKRSPDREGWYSPAELTREGFDINHTEPDPFWRYAYVRAINDLGVSTDGKGHFIYSVLDKVAESDPSAEVRAAARKGATALRKLRDGWKGGPHKRRLYEAFWWLRQAYLLSQGLEVDREAALKLRVQEGRQRSEE
jgi:hypothetical protein